MLVHIYNGMQYHATIKGDIIDLYLLTWEDVHDMYSVYIYRVYI